MGKLDKEKKINDSKLQHNTGFKCSTAKCRFGYNVKMLLESKWNGMVAFMVNTKP